MATYRAGGAARRERPPLASTEGACRRTDAGAGKIALGVTLGPVPVRVDYYVKQGLLQLVDIAVEAGWAHVRACEVL